MDTSQAICTEQEIEKIKQKEISKEYLLIKRIFDIIASIFALIVLSPLLLIVSIAIRVDSEGRAIYSQTRVGKDGNEFTLYKFRSMCKDAENLLEGLQKSNKRDGPAFKMDNDPRVTKVGSFLRKTCIDELPQLINIIKGDMSIVGPRPPLPREVAKYTDYQKQRLSVIPGLTCYWQIRKDDNTTFDEWVKMDLQYINDRSIWTDLKLIFKTFRIVLFRKGAM